MRDPGSFRVFELAHELAMAVYRETQTFPERERFALTSQLRRAAVSVPTNFAEGCGRSSGPDFARFLDISLGSAAEVDYLLRLGMDLGYMKPESAAELRSEIEKIRRMLFTLAKKVRS